MEQMIFIADLIACSTYFGHQYATHRDLESIIQVVAACGIWCFGFQVVGYGVELKVVCPVCGLLPAGTHCVGGWVGPMAGMDGCGKSRLHRDSIPYRPARSKSPYQLR